MNQRYVHGWSLYRMWHLMFMLYAQQVTLLQTNKAKTSFFGGKLEDLQVFFLLTKTGCFSREGRYFPAVLLPSKSRGLSREVGPSLDFLMAPKTGILSQTTMFSMFLCHNLTRA